MSNKKKKRVYRAPSKDPMKEITRLNKMLENIDVVGNVDASLKKVNQINNKIIESNTMQIANNLLEKKTIIKAFSNDELTIERYTANTKVEIADKPLIIGYLRDYGGCGHFRMIYPMNMINSKFSHTGKINCTLFPTMMYQDNVIPHVRSFVFQRPIGEDQIYKINAYKKYQKDYQYKMIGELDDYIFEYPEYHPGYEHNTIKQLRTLYVNLSKMDEITVSTDNLKNELIELGLTNKITVIKNYLPKHLYETDVKRYRLQEIKKPKIAFTGSNFHYNNEKKLEGDFNDNIKEFILDNNETYDFLFFGDYPYFVKDLVDEGKITIVPFTNPVEYAANLRKYRIDFVIAPLAENVFNSCKSDLRYLESAAIGALFIGSKFTGKLTSPYQRNKITFTKNTTKEQLKELIETYSNNLELFNKELDQQYQDISSRWLENINNIMEYIEVYTNGIKGLKLTETHPQYYQFRNFNVK